MIVMRIGHPVVMQRRSIRCIPELFSVKILTLSVHNRRTTMNLDTWILTLTAAAIIVVVESIVILL